MYLRKREYSEWHTRLIIAKTKGGSIEPDIITSAGTMRRLPFHAASPRARFYACQKGLCICGQTPVALGWIRGHPS